MSDEHSPPIKNWKQLLVVVVLAFLIPILLIVLITQIVTGNMHGAASDEAAVLARIRPVGEVRVAGGGIPAGQRTGEQVYGQVCRSCHEGGLAGSPRYGDRNAWKRIIAQGEKLAVDHAIKGLRAMPPRGGNPSLTDDEVHRGVAYMANNAGANWKAPPVSSPAAADRSGPQVVAAVCGRCHESGVSGAPKIGDRAAWRTRAARGFAAVADSALRGHAGMPARGGMAELSDAEVKRAIEFMMNSGTEVVAGAAAAPAAAADGKKIYDTACMACHGTGAAGAPKLGDKAAWSPRIALGKDALYASALKGKAAMPPKGGNTALADADVKAAVDYLLSTVK